MPISRQHKSGLKQPGSHLRSMREVLGYTVHATDGEAGTIEDFIIEDTLWGVHHVVVALKQPSPRSILVSPEAIRSISWTGKAALGESVASRACEKPRLQSSHTSESRQRASAVRLLWPAGLPGSAARLRGQTRGATTLIRFAIPVPGSSPANISDAKLARARGSAARADRSRRPIQPIGLIPAASGQRTSYRYSLPNIGFPKSRHR